MGTRAIIHVHGGGRDSEVLTTIYRQFDGYPDGLGDDIKTALGGKELVNGYNDPKRQVNGMGCAAAMLIGALKGGECGNVYVYKPNASDVGEEYTYRLYAADRKLMLEIDGYEEGDEPLYSGPLDDFDSSNLSEAA